MSDPVQYAVFLFASAIEELGAALEPYLQDGPSGRHVLCNEIDSGGALFEMKIHAPSEQGGVLELMVPVAMIKLVIAVQQDGRFGFARRPKKQFASAVDASRTTAVIEPEFVVAEPGRSSGADPAI